MDFEPTSESRDKFYRAILKENQELGATLSTENLLETPFKEVQNFGQDQIIKLSVSKNLQMKLSANKSPSRYPDEDEPLNKENIPLLATSKKIWKYSTDKSKETQICTVETKKNGLVSRLFSSITKDSIKSKEDLEILNSQSHLYSEATDLVEPVARDLNDAIEGVASHKKSQVIVEEDENNPKNQSCLSLSEGQLNKMIEFSSNKKSDEYLLEEVPSRLNSVIVNTQSPKVKEFKTIDLSTPAITIESQSTCKKGENQMDFSLLQQVVPLDISDGHVQFTITEGDDLPKIIDTLQNIGEEIMITQLRGSQTIAEISLPSQDAKNRNVVKKKGNSGSKRQSSYKKRKLAAKLNGEKTLEKGKKPEVDPLLKYLNKSEPEVINIECGSENDYNATANSCDLIKGNQSPMSMVFEKSLLTSDFLESTLKSSIDALSESIDKAKQKFEKLSFERFNYDRFVSTISPIKNSPSKKLQSLLSSAISDDSKSQSVDKSMIIESSTPSSSNCSKASINKYASELLQALLMKQKLPREEFSAEEIKSTLVKEFASQEYDPNMIECIQAILARKSCIYRASTANSKKLIYQVPALLSHGLVLYIHTSIAMMASHIQNLMPSLSGACLNSLLNREKSNSILELVKLNQVKILYITAERFLSEDLSGLPEISFICLDEAHYLPSSSSNHKSLYTSVFKQLKNSYQNIPIMSIIAPTTYETVDSLRNMMLIESSMIFPKEFLCNYNYDMTISCDDDKGKALINYLKRTKAQDHSLILYTESKKALDEVAAKLLQNGMKSFAFHNTKTESQKLEILSTFSRTSGGILVATSNTEIGIDKSFVKGVIHYSLPKSLEIYVQEISFLNENSYSHLFLNDEDYFRARQMINSSLIEKYQVKNLIHKILESKNRDPGVVKLKLNNQDSGSMLLLKLLKKDVPNSTGERNLSEMEHLQFFKVAELSAELDLNRDSIATIMEKISEKLNWFDFYGISPLICSLKILNPNILSNKSEYYPLIKFILEKGKKTGNIYKFNIVELANEFKSTPNDIFKTLKQLQQDGMVTYDVSEDVFCYKILFEPNISLLDGSTDFVFADLFKVDIMNIAKLDVAYSIFKKSSFQSIEHIYKHMKPEIKSGKIFPPLPKSQPVGKLNSGDKSSGQKKLKACLTEFLERYFNNSNVSSDGYEILFENFNQKIRELIPLPKLQTLKEKNNIITDITPFLGEFCDSVKFERMDDNSLRILYISRNIVKVLQGLPNYSSGKEWKSNKFWEKYYRYDYKELFDVVFENLSKKTW